MPARVVVCNSQGGTLNEGVPLYVYWGGKGGFDPDRRWVIPFSGGYGAVGADLNADGITDLVAMNSGHGGRAGPDVGAHILWGTSRGFDLEGHRTILSENHLSSGNVADLDRDGYLDLIAPSYHGTGVRESMPSYLFWGSRDGLRAENKTRLVCDSASDAMAGDFDQDGLLDLAVVCHTRHGDHRIDSKVFYNDGKRFAAPRTVGLPTLGGHTIYLTDVGHIYDRSWRQTYDSSLFHWDGDRSGGRLEAKAETPVHSRLRFRVRSGAKPSGLEQKPWRPVSGDSFTLESGDRVLQYQAVFESGNGDSYPILDRVSIELSSE